MTDNQIVHRNSTVILVSICSYFIINLIIKEAKYIKATFC